MKFKYDGSVEFTTVDALESLRPGAKWQMRGDVITWKDSDQTEPTKSQLDKLHPLTIPLIIDFSFGKLILFIEI